MNTFFTWFNNRFSKKKQEIGNKEQNQNPVAISNNLRRNKGVIVVISNRNVNERYTDHRLFGENPNAKGLDEIRVATAIYTEERKWQLELLPESDNLEEENFPSRLLFQQIMGDIQTEKRKKNWLFYIHGFNNSLEANLNACRKLQQTYGVDIITFSWPSNPGGFVTNEYQKARQAAKASSNAIDRTLEKLGTYLTKRPKEEVAACRISLNLLIHSMGNFLVENFIKDPVFTDETRIFDNIIFHQADVDNAKHSQWMDEVKYSKRIYITINENDGPLKASNAVNSPRLGNTINELNAHRAIYVDFTDSKNVEDAHGLFNGIPGNEPLNQFFQEVFTGKRGERVQGFGYDERTNTYRIVEEE